VYLCAGDDDPYITPGYDRKIIEAAALFPDGIGAVYGHLANASFPGAMALTRGLVDKLGHMFPPLFPYWFVDHWVDDIARMIGRVSFADIRTDQSRAGRTQEMREPGWWATFFDAGHLMRRQIAQAIIQSEDFAEPQWRKEILLRHYPLIEYRSKWINDNVRAQSRALTDYNAESNKDARYIRIRANAVNMVDQMLLGMEPAEAKRYRDMLVPVMALQTLPQNTGWM